MKVLIIGGGGREHALTWRLAQSPSVDALFAVPGNPGIARLAHCLAADARNPRDLLRVANEIDADLTVVGPEAPLVAGVVDALRAAGRAIVGPTAAAAQLEGSKIFAKEFMRRAAIPTADFVTARTETEAFAALDRVGCPVVLKADGLAAGKGVVVAKARAEAEEAVRRLLSGELVGEAGTRLVIEECLTGEEVSFIALTDGATVLPLEPTQDHKAVYDGDQGPNTGGMGAYCDPRILDERQREDILERIVVPSIEQMAAEGQPFTGFLYVGLMMTADGPKVLEYNVRLGDPENQALMHRLDCDFAEALMAAAHNELRHARLSWRPEPSLSVVLAAAGYPGKVRTGDPIRGIEPAEALGATVFHAGTRLDERGVVTAGGRVLAVTSAGADLAAAIDHTYAAVRTICFEGMHYRTDIGRKGLPRWASTPR